MSRRAIAVGLAIGAVLAAAIYIYVLPHPAQEIPMWLAVGDRWGINIDNTSLAMGTALPSSNVTRELELANGDARPVKVTAEAAGDLAEWVLFSENGFTLQPQAGRKLRITVVVPANASYGNYTGTLRLYFTPI